MKTNAMTKAPSRLIKAGLTATGLALAGTTQAVTIVPEKDGFSGYVNLGAGGINVESNMLDAIGAGHIEIGNSRINSLTNSPDDETKAVPVVNFELSYTFAKYRTQVFVGTLLEDYLDFDMFTRVGVRHDFGNTGIVSVSGMGSAGTRVWKDPYLANGRRQHTDATQGGFRVAWNNIMDTRLSMNYQWYNIDLDHERSGTALQLDRAEQKVLDRQGDVERFSVEYEFDLDNKVHVITPGVRYINKDLDGGAMARDGYGVYANYIYSPSGPWHFVFNASYSAMEANQSNPIYGKHDDSDRYGTSFTAFYKEPFGLKHWLLNGTVGYYFADHDVDFYDERVTGVAIAMFRRF